MGRKAAAGKVRPAKRQAPSLTLSDVHQVKVLADPLRIRILEELCTAERTTKQVAERLGEKPTKLYHHVEALERVGLIRLTRTRQNRGTMEKYYLAVARRFKADSRIFSAADAGSGPEGDALNSSRSASCGSSSPSRRLRRQARRAVERSTVSPSLSTHSRRMHDRRF